jgi:hypothetical protein
MKRITVVALLFVALFTVAACGAGQSTGGSGAATAPKDEQKATASSAAKPGQSYASMPAPDATVQGPRVIHTAALTVQVGSNGFDMAFTRIFQISEELGGYVSGGGSPEVDTGRLRSGTVTFTVPSDRFQDAISRVRGIGTVEQFSIGGQDVSAQYVDLQARLKNAQAQQGAYTALLSRATSINDIITIQTKLGEVTAQIEQLEGQIAYYDHATSFATISATIREGAAPPAPVLLLLGGAFAVWWRWFRRPAVRRTA